MSLMRPSGSGQPALALLSRVAGVILQVCAGLVLLVVIGLKFAQQAVFGPHERHWKPHRWFAWYPVRVRWAASYPYPVPVERGWVWLRRLQRSAEPTQSLLSFMEFRYAFLPPNGVIPTQGSLFDA